MNTGNTIGTQIGWDVTPSDYTKAVLLDAKRLSIRQAYAIFDGCVKRSPVDTGNFRASWRLTSDVPIYDYVIGGSSDNPLPPPKRPVIRPQAGFVLPKLYITNGQPYALRLENGWSKKAPMGIVRVTLESLK